MASPDHSWGTMHPSVYQQAANMVRWTTATIRAQGALRYQCPINGSLVLVTDEATLAGIARPHGRLRCLDCGEVHLLTQGLEVGGRQ
jgi:hypothetical protein